MGRGRAKAKQTKVARRLKYNSPEMDFDSLQKELASKRPGDGWAHEDDDEYEADPYAKYVDDWDDEDSSSRQ